MKTINEDYIPSKDRNNRIAYHSKNKSKNNGSHKFFINFIPNERNNSIKIKLRMNKLLTNSLIDRFFAIR